MASYRYSQAPAPTRRLSWFVAAVLFAMSLPSVAGDAASERASPPMHFDIPRQSIDAALLEYARQAQMQLVMATVPSAGEIESVSLHGDFTPQQALEILLRGSRYRYELSGARTVVIHVR
jgi:hypothetical protein